jgi:hypothetical protein
MGIRRTWTLAAIVVGAAYVGLAGTAGGAGRAQKETFTAFAVNMNSRGPSTATVDITIERWTTDEEQSMLLKTLQTKGPEALLAALQKMPAAGRIRTPDRIGYDLRYARQSPLDDGGRQIVVATDRPIGFWEARNAGRTLEYPFTLAEIHLNSEGKGEGKLSIATKITSRGNTLVLENYAIQPVQLNEVHKVK